MAFSVWFSVTVLISVQQVFARDCYSLERIRSCDECFRCGGNWCMDPSLPKEAIRCSEPNDNWCPEHRAEPWTEDSQGVQSVRILTESKTRIEFKHPTPDSQKKPQVTANFVNSSIPNLKPEDYSYLATVDNPECSSEGNCTTRIKFTPSTNFCRSDGTNKEYITFSILVDEVAKVATVKYHVACACQCSQSEEVVTASRNCNVKGDYSCGTCSCYDGWTGKTCEKETNPNTKDCERLDIPGCTSDYSPDLICSDNGRCVCDQDRRATCECYNHIDGSQYFDDYCTDICTTTEHCDACLKNGTLGPCGNDCNFPMTIENRNDTLLEERDFKDRKVWIVCHLKTENCLIKYATMKDRNYETHIMIMNSCVVVTESIVAPAGSVNVTVPVILGVVALVAAMAAAAGYMVWKNRTPPLPLTDPQYQNIDAEDCTGENPLYKPPTSSFKNPTYGKW